MSGFRIPAKMEIQFAKGANISLPGAHGFVIRSGWAFDYVMLKGGQRQITAVHLPGDYVVVAQPNSVDGEGIGAASAVEVEPFTADDLATEGHEGRVWHSLNYAERTRCAKLRTWMTVIGRKDALARCAHFLCELHERISIRDGLAENSFLMPMQQDHIGDAIGLTPVHVNRMFRALKEGNLARVLAGRVTINDLDRLRQIAGFDANYLKQADEPSPKKVS